MLPLTDNRALTSHNIAIDTIFYQVSICLKYEKQAQEFVKFLKATFLQDFKTNFFIPLPRCHEVKIIHEFFFFDFLKDKR